VPPYSSASIHRTNHGHSTAEYVQGTQDRQTYREENEMPRGDSEPSENRNKRTQTQQNTGHNRPPKQPPTGTAVGATHCYPLGEYRAHVHFSSQRVAVGSTCTSVGLYAYGCGCCSACAASRHIRISSSFQVGSVWPRSFIPWSRQKRWSSSWAKACAGVQVRGPVGVGRV